MIISFEFPDKTIDLQVDLVDNPAIHNWANHFLTKPFEVRSHVITNVTPHKFNGGKITELYKKCVDNINCIATFGFPYQVSMPESATDITRDWCNQTHRFFTHTQKYVNNMPTTGLEFEEYVTLRRTITDYLQELNDDIHLIEDYLPPQLTTPIDFSTDEIYCSNFPTYDAPGWWEMESEWRSYHTADHATVIFGPQILGKAVLRSYMDGDDPNDWDTTGHYCNGGTLLIQVSDFRNRVYTSETFRDWLSKWEMTPEQAVYDFPVGTVQDLDLVQEVYRRLKTSTDPIRTIYKQ